MSLKENSSSSDNSSDNESEDLDWSQFMIKDRYIVLNKIGKGSYCTVWSVYDINLKKILALKIYNEEDIDDAQNEIEVLNKIKEFNLPNVILFNESFNYNFGNDKYIMQTMDLCGYSLNYIIKLFKQDLTSDNFPYDKYVNFIYESYLKLDILINNLHRYEYCHTDIKPDNILIDIPILENNICLHKIKEFHNNLILNKNKKNLNKILHNECKKIMSLLQITDHDIKNYLKDFNYSIKLSDFGTALKIGDGYDVIYKKHTQYYKSPKILLKHPLDYTYDYWSIGCTLYELLTMEILFDPYDSDLEDKYGDNDDRNLMYLIISALGIPDKNILLTSKESDIYFDSTYTIPRGFYDIKFNNFIEKLSLKINMFHNQSTKNNYIYLLELIVKYLSYDYLYNKNTNKII